MNLRNDIRKLKQLSDGLAGKKIFSIVIKNNAGAIKSLFHSKSVWWNARNASKQQLRSSSYGGEKES